MAEATKCALVTGGAGFIGSNLVRHLLWADASLRIVNLDALTYAGSTMNLEDIPDPSRHTFVHGDIGDSALVERLLREHRVDTIVHLAAETHVDRSILGPAPFVQTNVVGTFTLLEAARAFWIGERAFPLDRVRFHHVSTDEVYGSLAPLDPPSVEDQAYRPTSPYAASKASADHLVRAYHRTYGLPVTLSICSNNYGPRQFPEKLIPVAVLNAAAGKAIPIYGDGQQLRDWVHVQDHCEAIALILRRGHPGETYHIGGRSPSTNLALIQQLCALLDEQRPHSPHRPHAHLIAFVSDRPAHDRRYDLDVSKIEAALGWRPRESLHSGLAKTTDWYLGHQEWVEAIRRQPGYLEWLELNYGSRQETA
jgi:dTDP-glucose 4,6-dehydratase